MPILTTQVDNIEDVPENLRGIYKESGGKYVVPEDLHPIVEAWNGLHTANENIRKENKQLQRRGEVDLSPLKDFGESIPDIATKVQERIRELQEAADAGASNKVNLDKVRQELKAAHAQEVEALKTESQKEVTSLQGALEQVLVNDNAVRAIAERKGDPDLLLPFVTPHVKVVKQEDGSYEPIVVDEDGDRRISSTTGKSMTVGELVDELRKNTKYQRLFDSEGKGGGGKPPGNSGSAGRGVPPGGGDRTSRDKIKHALEQRRR